MDEPELLLLDEPFVGLDPYGIQELLDILGDWVEKRNISMLISSHQLNELERICNRFVMLESGKLKTLALENECSLEQYFAERKGK